MNFTPGPRHCKTADGKFADCGSWSAENSK
ncbi:MAG: hypothetical protein JWQ03_3161, partial [Variovorax sp.]|nr:hypothetical protein [Variovorax sp.]